MKRRFTYKDNDCICSFNHAPHECVPTTDAKIYLTTSTSLARARSRRDAQLPAIAEGPGVPIPDHFLLGQAIASLCPTCRVRCARIHVATTQCDEPGATDSGTGSSWFARECHARYARHSH